MYTLPKILFPALLIGTVVITLILPGIKGEESPGGASPELQLLIGLCFLAMVAIVLYAVNTMGSRYKPHADGTRPLFPDGKLPPADQS